MAAPGEMETAEAQLRAAKREIGRLLAENQKLREQFNISSPFPGDSKYLLTAVYQGKYSASPEQIYAAKAVLGREHPACRYCRRPQCRANRSGN
jgi:hypothetical protein